MYTCMGGCNGYNSEQCSSSLIECMTVAFLLCISSAHHGMKNNYKWAVHSFYVIQMQPKHLPWCFLVHKYSCLDYVHMHGWAG